MPETLGKTALLIGSLFAMLALGVWMGGALATTGAKVERYESACRAANGVPRLDRSEAQQWLCYRSLDTLHISEVKP